MIDDCLILVVEDDPNLREAVCDTLQLSNYQVCEAENAEVALQILARKKISLIISDVQMPGMDGHEFLSIVKRQYPSIPFVLVTAYGTVSKAVDAIQSGAADYIVKPFEAAVLIEMVNRLAISTHNTEKMVIADPLSQELADLAKRVASTNISVMISGESGTGKEIYSRFIHEQSSRSQKPFLAINCAAIPEAMLESILFGYEKGAFTGAHISRAGKFEQANHGTLLLDEISEMDIGLQAKLLRVIQEKEVERLGSNKTIPLDVRIIATTNRNLKDDIAEGRFREDLFYRLSVFPIHLPPLRERPLDILPLVNRIIEHHQPGQGVQLSESTQSVLLEHRWPGNIRELENVIQRALILKVNQQISPEDILFEEINSTEHNLNKLNYSQNSAQEDTNKQLESDLKAREQELIINALVANNSRKEVAEKLGISPRTLRYKIAQFRKNGIAIPQM